MSWTTAVLPKAKLTGTFPRVGVRNPQDSQLPTAQDNPPELVQLRAMSSKQLSQLKRAPQPT